MKLIKILENRINKDGISTKWGLFKCEKCGKEVEKKYFNGIKQKTCSIACKDKRKSGHKPYTLCDHTFAFVTTIERLNYKVEIYECVFCEKHKIRLFDGKKWTRKYILQPCNSERTIEKSCGKWELNNDGDYFYRKSVNECFEEETKDLI